mmetsp:Transcript_80903/g.203523  ORF Transcript_80903/g.203523 Transcript_80903/m.203523 type:complete len:222 (+) Transcript_80903:281-946(+)
MSRGDTLRRRPQRRHRASGRTRPRATSGAALASAAAALSEAALASEAVLSGASFAREVAALAIAGVPVEHHHSQVCRVHSVECCPTACLTLADEPIVLEEEDATTKERRTVFVHHNVLLITVPEQDVATGDDEACHPRSRLLLVFVADDPTAIEEVAFVLFRIALAGSRFAPPWCSRSTGGGGTLWQLWGFGAIGALEATISQPNKGSVDSALCLAQFETI